MDIGAGNGKVAKLVALSAQKYVAFEQDLTSAAALKELGIVVYSEKFPSARHFAETFDLVVASHSMPLEKADELNKFLKHAWDAVIEGGALITIAFFRDTYSPILTYTNSKKIHDSRYDTLLSSLHRLGNTHIFAVTSNIKTNFVSDIEQIFKPFLFYEHENAGVKGGNRMRKMIWKRFWAGSCFVVPTLHTVTITERQNFI